MMNFYAPSDIEACIASIFRADGSSESEAASIARHLCSANLAGHESHGLLRVPLYLEWREQGKVRYAAQPEVIKDAGAQAS